MGIGPIGAPKYTQEPKPAWWSPWRRWIRYLLLILPLLLGLGSLVVLVVVAAGSLLSTPAFAGAIVGALIATFGNLLVQYLLALIQNRRAEGERIRREIGITTLLMAELGEALVRMRVNAALMKEGSTGD